MPADYCRPLGSRLCDMSIRPSMQFMLPSAFLGGLLLDSNLFCVTYYFGVFYLSNFLSALEVRNGFTFCSSDWLRIFSPTQPLEDFGFAGSTSLGILGELALCRRRCHFA